jgi:isopentenyl diphosphate isomerase/L-lactate dehydrogenase-like FMN-dependent dehydrogenase
VVKAVALGATAVLVGRPYMFGLAAGGEAGVARVLEIFRTEIEQTMGLLGCPTIADVDRSVVAIPERAVRSSL